MRATPTAASTRVAVSTAIELSLTARLPPAWPIPAGSGTMVTILIQTGRLLKSARRPAPSVGRRRGIWCTTWRDDAEWFVRQVPCHAVGAAPSVILSEAKNQPTLADSSLRSE